MAYAVKGSPLARDLWLYKSGRPGSGAAGSRLLLLLLAFLHDHGARVWRRRAWPARATPAWCPAAAAGPARIRSRPWPPPDLALPWAELRRGPAATPGPRSLDPGRFRAGAAAPEPEVLLLDDTWTSGASAQSAAVALKLAGAQSVAVVVLGRHLLPEPGLPAFETGRCAVHRAAR